MRRAGILAVPVVELLAVDDEQLADRRAGPAEQRDLLGLVLLQRGPPRERVEVVLREGFARERHGRRHVGARGLGHHLGHLPVVADAIELAGHQLQVRVAVRGAARVVHRDPAVEIGVLVVARDGQHVVGVPRHVACQVRRLDPVLPSAAVVQLPHQRGPAPQVVGNLGKPVLFRVEPGDDLVADLPHRRVVEREQQRAHFLLARRAVLLPRAHERDLAADVLPEQPLRVQQVVLIVLFQDAELARLAQRPDMHGRRVHRRRDVEQAEIERAARQRHLPHVADQRDVRVVDGDGQIDLVLQRRGNRGVLILRGTDGAVVVTGRREHEQAGQCRDRDRAACAKCQ